MRATSRWAWIAAVLVLAATVPLAPGQAPPADDPVPPPVVGYWDSGINPYHVAFRAPNWTEHPSNYIPGYPASAKPLNLTLDADSYEAALQADADVWDRVEPGQLYYVPGTRIVGAMTVHESEPILDESGHGTKVADAAVGNRRGAALRGGVVAVTGPAVNDAFAWMHRSPWIDVVSLSFNNLAQAGPPDVHAADVQTNLSTMLTYRIAEDGRSVVVAGGNGPPGSGPSTNILDSYAGPPWTFTVGGSLDRGTILKPEKEVCLQCDRPIEAAARMRDRFAAHDAITETDHGSGTSFSTPTVAGYAARLVHDARAILDDPGNQATHPGLYAKAADGADLPDRGPLADGDLNRTELEDVLRRTAIRVPAPIGPFDGEIDNPDQTSYYYQGYGVVNDTSYEHARRVLLGEQPMPDRPADDRWHDRFQRLAQAYWEPWICAYHQDGDVTRWPGCWAEQVPDP